jgi:hypothetical protein
MKLPSEDAARMRHNRAIRKLITRIGGFRPWLDKDTSEKVAEEPDEVVSADNYSEEYSGRSNSEEDTE